MRRKLHIKDVQPGMKLRCVWYPDFAAACGKPYGVAPNHPRRGEVVTVDKVLSSEISISKVRQRIALREYHNSNGFSLSSFDVCNE